MRMVYLIMAFIGTVIPGYFFVQFLMKYGFDTELFWTFLITNEITVFFSTDLIFSSIVMAFFIIHDRKFITIPMPWLYILFNFTVGLSLALPAYLYMRTNPKYQQEMS